ncbi:MAG TPA: asparaginase [Patescibacteria group bacterium]|nr:asparaginase [Patescibacteria group bacterium]
MNSEKPLKPRVAIIFTGGTIAMKLDEAFGGVVPALSASDILDAVPGVRNMADVEVYEFGRFPGPHMTPEKMFTLSQLVQQYVAREEITGVVITHGTDTLEETAYFLDCTLHTQKSVVVVGAMRNSSEPDWDGPKNLRDGIIIASHPGFKNFGTMICLAGTVNAASEASKTDTNELNTFESFDFGPLGRISSHNVILYRKPLHRETFSIDNLPKYIPLFKCYAGMGGELIHHAIELGADGIVVEAFGVGNVPPPVFYELAEAVKKGIPVVLASRCPVGRTEHIYAYEGAGKQLYESGVIFCDFLNGQKARIKLMAALGAGLNYVQLKKSFEWVEHGNSVEF